MQTTLIEAERLKAVRDLSVMDDTRGQEAYDRIARLAKHLFGTDVAAITFIDDKRQWFKSHIGLDLADNRRDDAFCDITIHERSTIISARNLEEDGFVDRLSRLLEHYSVAAKLLEIEIVEDAALGTIDRVRDRLDEIASLGVTMPLTTLAAVTAICPTC